MSVVEASHLWYFLIAARAEENDALDQQKM